VCWFSDVPNVPKIIQAVFFCFLVRTARFDKEYVPDLLHLFCILHMLCSAKLVLSLSYFSIDDKHAILEVLGYSTPSSPLQLKYWLYLSRDYFLQVWFVGSS